MPVTALRDHAEQMLRFIAAYIETEQSESQWFAKSLGHPDESSGGLSASQEHGLARATERFTVDEMTSEYRALRASVTRMWLGHPDADVDAARQLVRFNEAIDQLLAESMKQFIAKESQDTEMFTAVIGHDLRNPLNAVAVAAQLLGSSETMSTHDREILNRIQDAVSRQGRLLDQLSDFSRLRLGGLRQIERVEYDVHDLCSNVVNELRLTDPNIELTRSGDTRDRWIGRESRSWYRISSPTPSSTDQPAARSPSPWWVRLTMWRSPFTTTGPPLLRITSKRSSTRS